MGGESNTSVLIQNANQFNAIAIGGWLKSGALNDYEGKYGLHHFMEHIIFNVPPIRLLSESLKERGVVINAFTSHEIICFYAVCLEEDYESAFTLISNILFSKLNLERDVNFENEKKIILNEIKYHESYSDYLKQLLLQQLFHINGDRFTILGNEKSVLNMSNSDVRLLYEDISNNCMKFITVIGNSNKLKSTPALNLNEMVSDTYKPLIPDIDIKDTFLQELSGQDEDCLYGIGIYYPKLYRKEGLIFTEYVKNELLKEIRENNGVAYRIDSSNMNFSSGVVSFLILKVMKKDVDFVKHCVDIVLGKVNEDLLHILIIIQKRVLNRSLIKNDNVLSRMLNLGHENTILINEAEAYDVASFLKYLKKKLDKGENYYCQRIISRTK